MVSSIDFYPTILEFTNISLPLGTIDGISLVSAINNNKEPSRDAIYWHYPHYHGSGNKPSAAIRKGNYKLIQWFEDNSVELYKLSEDPQEQHNLMDVNPERIITRPQRLAVIIGGSIPQNKSKF